MPRLLVARLWHEGNSFSPQLATLKDFMRGEWWRGSEVGRVCRGGPAELGAAVAAADDAPAGEVVFSRCASAAPCGPLAAGLFGAIRDEIVADVRRTQPESIYLSLHGALLAVDEPTPDLALLRAVREAAGPKAWIGVSLDLHANLHPAMLALAQIFSAYRSYPHTDMHETAERVLRLLDSARRGAIRPRSALAPLKRVLPSHEMRTSGSEGGPMAEVMHQLLNWEAFEPGVLTLSVLGGFAYADVPHAGAAGLACVDEAAGATPDIWAARVRDELGKRVKRFYPTLPSAEQGLDQAMQRLAAGATRPVALLDPADNPLSGGVADTTALLRAVLARRLQEDTVFAFFHDPVLVGRAAAAGVGAEIDVALGGRLMPAFGAPVPLRVKVVRLTDGLFTNRGPMWAGQACDIGRSVVLQDLARRLRIVVSSRCEAPNDPAWFALHGIELSTIGLLCVKGKNHFRAAFAQTFDTMIDIDAPGLACLDLSALPFKHVPPERLRR